MLLGLFDSGIGGLTVVRELLRRYPDASFVYLGDTARAPYGNKTPETIQRYAIEDVQFLLSQGATHIVIACNTASAIALEALKQHVPHIPFFDVITPTVEACVALDRQKHIGVIGTRATINSSAYESQLRTRLPKAYITSVACPLFVPIVEEGYIHHPETKRIVRRYLQPLRQKQADALILGCTHYPLLQDVIRASLQNRVHIIDAPSALLDTIELQTPALLRTSSTVRQAYFFTDPSPLTDTIASRWLKTTVQGVRAVLTPSLAKNDQP